MFYLSETNKQYSRYFILLAVVILGVASILGSGGGGDSGTTPPPPAAPSVIAVTPGENSDTALVTTVVTAQFNERMDSTTVDVNSFTLHDSGMIPVTGIVEYKGSYDGHDYVAVFTPVDPNNVNILRDLLVGETYTAMVTTAVTDIDDNPLARDHVWSFQIAPAMTLVSTDGSDGTLLSSTSEDSAINQTGEYIVFTSVNTLVPNLPTGGIAQVYRKNTITGKVEVVSTTSNNLTIADGPCATPRISDTGRFVVFASTAINLDPTISNPGGTNHIYRKDMRDGTINLLDVIHDDTSVAATGDSTRPDVSAQGNFVVFESTAANLVDNDTNGLTDIFIVNPSGTIERVSIATSGNQSQNGDSYNPRVSSDGQRIVFQSEASDLVAGDSGGHTDILYRDRNATTTNFVSVDSNELQADADSTNADISADGNFVVFQSAATNLDLVVGDTNSKIDIFLRDLINTTTTRLSLKSDGTQTLNGDSTSPTINIDGSYVAFSSTANDLVSNDPNITVTDVFVRDTLAADSIKLLSVSPSWTNNQPSTQAAISADGRYVSFTTPNKFDDNDVNGVNDIYRAYNSALP